MFLFENNPIGERRLEFFGLRVSIWFVEIKGFCVVSDIVIILYNVVPGDSHIVESLGGLFVRNGTSL